MRAALIHQSSPHSFLQAQFSGGNFERYYKLLLTDNRIRSDVSGIRTGSLLCVYLNRDAITYPRSSIKRSAAHMVSRIIAIEFRMIHCIQSVVILPGAIHLLFNINVYDTDFILHPHAVHVYRERDIFPFPLAESATEYPSR